ncbi:MAG: phosphate ABC transporter substrate-binding protein PstS [Ignavibacteria bacterium]|nr:phosphate ABC transporter substrate-binding protein PstS [Ignavibacteria bacterium]MBK9228031.1 phosphate ABC transporter substrate-binding protein PstS [Ignavibacteria bacterium]
MIKSLIFSIALLFLISCGKNEKIDTPKTSQLNGAGATFPYPLYSKWFNEYAKLNKDAKINYQSIGSGGGVKQITEGTVDFGASDSPMSTEEIEKANQKNSNSIIHIPTVIGSVVLTYNVPGIAKEIKLTPEAIVGIFMGTIKKWNDPKIAKENTDISLPDKDIIVCYRTDGSGTTYVFADFLGKVSEEWKTKVGVAKDVRFPVGQGGKGNEGVTGLVKQLEYSIGYVELVYAMQNKLQYAYVKNADGEFVKPSLDALSKAAEQSVNEMPDDLRQSITNAKGKESYPISSYTYLLIYEKQKDQYKGKTLKEFLNWALTQGESFASELGYAPLPKVVIEKALQKVNKITVQ